MPFSSDHLDELNLLSLFDTHSLQRGKGLKRATDLLERNPKSVIAAGILSMIIFFLICFTASQLAIKYLTN